MKIHLIQNVKNRFMDYTDRIKYTAKHKKAFLKIEKELTGKNTIGGYFHDSDKLFMYIIGIPQNIAHSIHIATAPHHVRNGKIKKPVKAVIDWECARYTKPDKPLNAREFYEKHFINELHQRLPEIESILESLGL